MSEDDEKLLREITKKLSDLKRQYSGKPDDFRVAAESLLQSYNNLPPEAISLIENSITQAFKDAEVQNAQANVVSKEEPEKTPEEKFLDEVKKLKTDAHALISRVDTLDADITKTTNTIDQIEKDLAKTAGPPTDQQRKDFEKAQEELAKYEEEQKKLKEERDRIQAELDIKKSRFEDWEKELKSTNISLERKHVLEHSVNQGNQDIQELGAKLDEFDTKHKQTGNKLQVLKDAINRVKDIFKARNAKKVQDAEVKKGEGENKEVDDIGAAFANRQTQQSEQVGADVQGPETSVITANNDIKHATQADKTPTDSTKLSSPIKSFFNGIIGKVKAAVTLVTNQFTPHQEHENVQKKQDTPQVTSNKGTLIDPSDHAEHSQPSNPTTRIDPLTNPKAFAKSCTAIFSQQTCVATGKPYSKTTLKKAESHIESHYTALSDVRKGKEHGDLGKTLQKDKDKIKTVLEHKTDKASHTNKNNNKQGHSGGTGYDR